MNLAVIGAAIIWICSARSLTGIRYHASDPDEATAQELAMEKCEEHHWQCYPGICKQEIHEDVNENDKP